MVLCWWCNGTFPHRGRGGEQSPSAFAGGAGASKIQARSLMAQGITLLDPDRFDLRGTLQAPEGDVCIDVNVVISGTIPLARTLL